MEQAVERLDEVFRPYRYPSPPRLKSLADPCETPFSLQETQQPQQQDSQEVQRHQAAPSVWEVLLQVVNVLLLAYLCFSVGDAAC